MQEINRFAKKVSVRARSESVARKLIFSADKADREKTMKLRFATTATTLAVSATLAIAQGPAVFNTTGGTVFSSFDSTHMTIGWGFTVGNADIIVSALAIWDEGGAGLSSDARVGIWDAGTGVLMGSTTVLMNDPIDGTDGFRYHAVTPFQLSAGTAYNIGAEIVIPGTVTNTYKSSVPTISVDPLITFTNARGNLTMGGFSNPTTVSAGNGRFGSNMTIAAVPEPGTFIALGAGIALLALRRRK